MDLLCITDLLQKTLEPQNEQSRSDAETQLKEASGKAGFLSLLLQLVMMDEVPIPVRQAGVIYLKNTIGKNWKHRETDESQIFIVNDIDKQFVRDNIIDAVISAADIIRRQLTVCAQEVLSFDYPDQWPAVPAQLENYLTKTDADPQTIYKMWHGALLVLYQLVKKYEYKREADRDPVLHVMEKFLPLLQNRCASFIKENSPECCTLVALIFKIFRSLIQLNLPIKIVNEHNIPQWMGMFTTVLEKAPPEESNENDEDDRPQMPFWKAKKWAITLISKIFDRYGCVGSVEKQYARFAEFYDKNYSESMTTLMLAQLDQHRRNEYVTPRILHHALSYLTQGLYNARSWKIVKPHLNLLIREVIFPFMCHSEDDETLWHDDPQEYIRSKYDVFEDFLLFSPNEAAKAYLARAAEKRKDVLKPCVEFIQGVFQTPKEQCSPYHKDGAMHMLGALAECLNKKKLYKSEMEKGLVNWILPEFDNESHGFLRARACWVVQQFSITEFTVPENLQRTIQKVLERLGDPELPVQVEAGIAVKHLIENQEEKASDIIRPHVQLLVERILNVLNQSENDELTGTIAKLVECYPEEMKIIAVPLVKQLSITFMTLVTSEDDYDNKSVTAMGVLETLQTVMGELEQSGEIIQQLEKEIYNLIITVLQKELMEFYEEIFALINECTVVNISPIMWELLEVLSRALDNDTADYFTEMMPCLHNYVTVDPKTFLENDKYIKIVYNMCKKMLLERGGEDAEMQAAKLLEVIILQYGPYGPQHDHKIDQWLGLFIQLALNRLANDLRTSELRVMLIQVIVASILNNPKATLEYLSTIKSPSIENCTMDVQMLSLWLQDTDCFLGLHDRKIYVLGICKLLEFEQLLNSIPAIREAAVQFLPKLLVIFNGLKQIYEKIHADDDDDEEGEEDEIDGDGELEDSDDEYDEDGVAYVEKLEKAAAITAGEIDVEDDWENDLDIFTTPVDDNPDIDEYIQFKSSFEKAKSLNPEFFALMTNSLTAEQTVLIQEVINEGLRREKIRESIQIEAQGGFKFNSTQVNPQNFSFGGALS